MGGSMPGLRGSMPSPWGSMPGLGGGMLGLGLVLPVIAAVASHDAQPIPGLAGV